MQKLAMRKGFEEEYEIIEPPSLQIFASPPARVTRDENHLAVGTLAAQLFSQRDAIHFRHADVADKDIGWTITRSQQGRTCIVECFNIEFRFKEDNAQQIGNLLLVINNKHLLLGDSAIRHKSPPHVRKDDFTDG